ncbi:SAP domain-containing protein, partial [Kocuria salsicia]|uniref:SAP domain-containing protein n=1 Tax=Kocuria salsicia TaxID=664639 RepID=UPI001C92BF84
GEDPAGKEEDSAPEGEDPAGKEEDSAPEGEDPAGKDEDAELRAKLSKHTADQLRDLASEQGLSTAGNKAELIDRLLG